MKVNPYLVMEGNAEEAFNFYKSVFGGEFESFSRFKDMPMPGPELTEENGNLLMHVSLPIGDNALMGSDGPAVMGVKVNHDAVHVSVHPDSKEEADKIFNGLAEGGEVEMAIEMAPWGDYYGQVKDKFGISWMVNFHEDKAE